MEQSLPEIQDSREKEKMMLGKVGSCAVTLAMLSCCILFSGPQEVITEASEDSKIQAPPGIIETMTLKPAVDVVTLAGELVHSTKLCDSEDNTLQVSYDDARRLMMIAEAEAGDQGIEGMLKVMEVVINRVDSKDYPDSIKEVIEQPYQFQPVTEGKYYITTPSVNAHLALAELEKNKNPDKDIIAFETVENSKTLEQYFDYAYTFRGHDFYVAKSR